MKQTPLDRLLDLRRHREEKALETLTMRENAHRTARARLDDAKTAVVQHAAWAKGKEQELIAAALGQNLTQFEITRIQLNLEVMAIEHKDLQKAVEAAAGELRERRKELDKARQVYRDLRQESEKLSELIQLQKAKALRRQLSLNEALDEDQTGLLRREQPSQRPL
jgi:flagellar biosynthesis chaperone FliJ